MKYGSVFLGVALCVFCSVHAHKPKYDLSTHQVYINYLPERLRSLVGYVKKVGIKQACSWVQADQDLNSYLFILDAQKPYTFLAYSRAPELINKTAQELQKQLPPTAFGSDSMEVIFERLVSTARKCNTFVSCKFHFNQNNPFVYQVALVHLLSEGGKDYVLASAVFSEYSRDYFVVPHRVKTFANRIKKESLEKMLPVLAHDADKENYFFIAEGVYPFRQIVNGGSDKIVRISADEVQRIFVSDCSDPLVCSVAVWYERMMKIAKAGGGFFAYVWPSQNRVSIKIAYVHYLEEKKRKYMLCSGFRLENAPDNLHGVLRNRVERYLSMVKTIGLENTVSVGHRENKPGAYVFIIETAEPNYILLYSDTSVEGKPALSLQQAVTKRCTAEMYCSNALDVIAQEVRLAKEGGGFYSYAWQTEEIPPKTFVKVSYLKPFECGGKNYYVGSGYMIG